MGETAQGVGREQPSTEGLPTGADRVGENIVTGGAPRAGLGRRRPVASLPMDLPVVVPAEIVIAP